MNAPAVLLVIRWLVRDTFRQARASGISWLMLTISVLSIALCFSVRIEGDVPLTWDGPNRPEAQAIAPLLRGFCNLHAGLDYPPLDHQPAPYTYAAH